METSDFAEKNMVEISCFFRWKKDHFVIKIPVLTAKTRFSHRKEYFTFEIVFYSGKDRFVIKIPVLTPKRGFLVEKSTLHLK